MENFDENIFSFFDDDEFIRWVSSNEDDADAYWKAWMQKNPGKIKGLLQARQVAQELSKAQKPLIAKKLSEDIWEKINLHIEKQQQQAFISLSPYSPHKRQRLMIAASIGGLLLAASSIYYFSTIRIDHANATAKITTNVISNDLNHVNNTPESRLVYLVDGTKITLQPGASLKHAVFLQKDKREVYLDGDAFFEVAKDASRPFYVYAHDIVLRVLGTSFNVTTNKKNGNVTVLVKTGKVSVFKSSSKNKAEFILTPTQSIRYTAQTQSIVKSESDAELEKAETNARRAINFDFEETPIVTIFSALEDAYGIKMNYDEKVFSKCIITAPLRDEPFEEKLKIICAAVGAKYHIDNNEVFVEGTACK
ncbi:MAG TPA: FecR domain-containing protein [Puia sp.]|nr:FecR domain-containing protein [Puia sp.]